MARTNRYTARRRKGIVTPYGQWLYPGQVTTIPGNNITMRGVPYPVFGISDKGDAKMMMPGMDYLFNGNEVTEYPVMQQGGFGRKRVEKNGMEYLPNTDGYTGVVQKQTQHGLGVSRRYDAPEYQYYDNGNPVGKSWRGAGDFQNDIVKDYESEPVVPFNRKYSNYDPNSLTFFKDLATGETPFKPYEMPLDRSLLNPSIGNGISQSVIANSFPTYIPPTANHVSAVSATTNNVPDNSHRNRFDQWNDYREKYWYGKMSGEADMNKNSYTSEYRRNSNGDAEDFTTIGFGNTGIPYGTTWDYNTAIEKSFDSWDDHIQLAKRYYNNMKKEHQDWPEWDALPQFTRDLFGHYNYGVRNGIMGFPKFVGAMATGDYDTALKEYTIKNNKKRNDYVGGWLNFMLGNADVYPDPMNKSNMREGYNYQNGGRIHIKEANRGKFTEAAQRAGKSVQAYAAQILANKDNYSPTIIKRANFARNAAKWKHQTGEIDKYLEGNYIQPKTVDSVMGAWNDMLAKRLSKGDMIANHVGNALNAAATASAAAATQFGKNFTKDIMAGQGDEQTSVAAPLYWPAQQNNNIQPLNNGYYGFPVIDNGGSPYKSNQTIDIFSPVKGATGGNTANNVIELERGEIIKYGNGDEVIANDNATYHEQFSDNNEKNGTRVMLTGDAMIDTMMNPALTFVPGRKNKYTIARHGGREYMYPSTTQLSNVNAFGVPGLAEPKDGLNYPLAAFINGSKAQSGGIMVRSGNRKFYKSNPTLRKYYKEAQKMRENEQARNYNSFKHVDDIMTFNGSEGDPTYEPMTRGFHVVRPNQQMKPQQWAKTAYNNYMQGDYGLDEIKYENRKDRKYQRALNKEIARKDWQRAADRLAGETDAFSNRVAQRPDYKGLGYFMLGLEGLAGGLAITPALGAAGSAFLSDMSSPAGAALLKSLALGTAAGAAIENAPRLWSGKRYSEQVADTVFPKTFRENNQGLTEFVASLLNPGYYLGFSPMAKGLKYTGELLPRISSNIKNLNLIRNNGKYAPYFLRQTDNTLTRVIGTGTSGIDDYIEAGILRSSPTGGITSAHVLKKKLEPKLVKSKAPRNLIDNFLSNNLSGKDYKWLQKNIPNLFIDDNIKVKGFNIEKKAVLPKTYEEYLANKAFSKKQYTYNSPTFALNGEDILNNHLFRGDYAVQIKNADIHGVPGDPFINGHLPEHWTLKQPMSIDHPDVAFYKKHKVPFVWKQKNGKFRIGFERPSDIQYGIYTRVNPYAESSIPFHK